MKKNPKNIQILSSQRELRGFVYETCSVLLHIRVWRDKSDSGYAKHTGLQIQLCVSRELGNIKLTILGWLGTG